MENMIYKNPEEFGELLAELSEEETEIHVVADFWTIRDILSEIVLYDEFYIDNIFLISPDILDNENEYLLSIFDSGAINISQALHKNEYIKLNDDSLIFIFEDVNSKFAIKNKNSRLIEVDYCDGDCEHCHFN